MVGGGGRQTRSAGKEITADFCKVPASTVTAQPGSSPVPRPHLSSGTGKSREEPWPRGRPAGVTHSVPSRWPRASPAAARLALAHPRAGQRGCRGRTRPWGRRRALCCSAGPAAGPALAVLPWGERGHRAGVSRLLTRLPPAPAPPRGPSNAQQLPAGQRGEEKPSREGWAGTVPVLVPCDLPQAAQLCPARLWSHKKASPHPQLWASSCPVANPSPGTVLIPFPAPGPCREAGKSRGLTAQ